MIEIPAIILENPFLLGLIIALVRNLFGFLEMKLRDSSKSYDVKKLGETIMLYEAVLIPLGAIPALPTYLPPVIAFVVDALRSMKKAIADQ